MLHWHRPTTSHSDACSSSYQLSYVQFCIFTRRWESIPSHITWLDNRLATLVRGTPRTARATRSGVVGRAGGNAPMYAPPRQWAHAWRCVIIQGSNVLRASAGEREYGKGRPNRMHRQAVDDSEHHAQIRHVLASRRCPTHNLRMAQPPPPPIWLRVCTSLCRGAVSGLSSSQKNVTVCC